MAQINDGGNFSPDVYARLLALKNGSASEDELAQNEQTSQDAAQAGQNAAMGTMGGPQGSALKALAEGTAPAIGENMANDIQQAAKNSSVTVLPSAADNEAAQFAQNAQGKPNFFEQFGAKGAGRNVPDEQMAQYQTGLRQQAQQEQLAQQLQQRKYQALQNALKGQK